MKTIKIIPIKLPSLARQNIYNLYDNDRFVARFGYNNGIVNVFCGKLNHTQKEKIKLYLERVSNDTMSYRSK